MTSLIRKPSRKMLSNAWPDRVTCEKCVWIARLVEENVRQVLQNAPDEVEARIPSGMVKS